MLGKLTRWCELEVAKLQKLPLKPLIGLPELLAGMLEPLVRLLESPLELNPQFELPMELPSANAAAACHWC